LRVGKPETSQLVLETARLALEPWSDRHRPAWRKICGDPEVMRYIGFGGGGLTAGAELILGNRDSNPNFDVQSVACCRYTIPQCNRAHRADRVYELPL
jgi:hypothetical protein